MGPFYKIQKNPRITAHNLIRSAKYPPHILVSPSKVPNEMSTLSFPCFPSSPSSPFNSQTNRQWTTRSESTILTIFFTIVDMPPPPQQQPIRSNCVNNNRLQNPTNAKLPPLPDLLLTALSISFLFSSAARATLFSKTPFLHFPSCPRRFLKISAMSLHHHSHHFTTPQSLSDWLKPRLRSDSLASWGVKPGTKNVHNLWLELSEGESFLADSTPPVRTVHVVTVRIIDDKFRFLVESHQELSDGSVRDRGRPLSEKMKPGEDPESAANRAVMEELGSILKGSVSDSGKGDIVKIVPGSYEKKVEERNSASYPGLPACYELHSVDAWVEGLPEGEFCTEEEHEYANCGEMSIAHEAVSVKKHFWKWVSLDSVKS